MAQPLSVREISQVLDDTTSLVAKAPKRQAKAFVDALDQVVRELRDHPGRMTSATAALRATAAAVGSRTAPLALPAAERKLWQELGASFDADSVVEAEATAAAAFADLVERSVVGDAAVAELLGVDRTRISQRLASRSLYAFTGPGDRCFPRWQFAGRRTVPGLRTVLEALDAGLHPLTVDHWFRTPSVDLEVAGESVSPAAWLATSGRPAVLAELAADL